MSELLDKYRRARERDIAIAGHVYTVRRPTALQRIEMLGLRPVDMVRQCVVGWDLQLIDLMPGGAPTPAPFAELWSDWLDDQPDLWAPLVDAVADLVREHDERMEETEKN